jgi:hypothetical protein
MIYVEPSQIGWRPLMTSWLDTLTAPALEEHKPHLVKLFEWLVDPSVKFLRRNCKELIPTVCTDRYIIVSLHLVCTLPAPQASVPIVQ